MKNDMFGSALMVKNSRPPSANSSADYQYSNKQKPSYMAQNYLTANSSASPTASNMKGEPSNTVQPSANLNEQSMASITNMKQDALDTNMMIDSDNDYSKELFDVPETRRLSRTGKLSLTWSDINVNLVASTRPCCGKQVRLPKLCAKTRPIQSILKDVNGAVDGGDILAIMGTSGSGKTTLLNLLNFRTSAELAISGDIYVSDVLANQTVMGEVSAYVEQDDLFIGELTVNEHLKFHSRLRMNRDLTSKEKNAKTDGLIRDFGLTLCQNAVIGVPGRIKGISGGEMKRLALATELLSEPGILFCDEPTSGLDAFLAMSIIHSLQLLAKQGMTIICTIHQPSSETFNMFDKLMLLAKGRVLYFGNAHEGTNFFSKIYNVQCPNNYNPADFLVHEFALRPGKETESLREIKKAAEKYEDTMEKKDLLKQITALRQEKSAELQMILNEPMIAGTYAQQFKWLMWRGFYELIRQPYALRVRFIQAALIGVLLGLIYLRLPINQNAVQNFTGAAFIIISNLSFGNMFAVINVFPAGLPLFIRERRKNVYSTAMYYITKVVINLVLTWINAIIFSSICYWMMGFYSDAKVYLVFLGVSLLVATIAAGFGTALSAAAGNVDVALTLASPLIIPLMLFAGLFLNNDSTPSYFVWVKYISWFKFGYEMVSVNQWENIYNIDCEPGRPVCYTNGTQVLHTFGMDDVSKLDDSLGLIGLAIGFHLLGLVFLYLRKRFAK
ncbi:hypothetical protein SNEBB_004313 [Seison nebaliae]|nr:hypothetical protein SNEBB_004313 [Seison nebaliae]